MSQRKKRTQEVTPRLRFPEFRGAWEVYTLIEMAKFRRGSFPQPYGLPEWYDKENGTPFIQVFDVNDDLRLKTETKNKISNLGAKQSVFIPKGTLIVTLQGSIGRVAITQYDAYIDRTLLLFESFIKPTNKVFFAYTIQNLFEIEKRKAPGGIIKTITKEVLSGFKVKLPPLPEQRKIADCLTALDARITAHSDKLAALKAHKQGLLQQLFPAEGETVPRLRFPEFRGAWEEKRLTNLSACSLSNGVFNDPKKVGKGYKLINVSDMYIGSAINEDILSLLDITDNEFLKNKVKNGDIFFTRSSLVASGIAYSNIYLGNSDDVTFDGHLIRFRPNKKIVVPVFVNYLLKTNKVRSQLVARGKTATMTTIGQTDVGSVKLSIPYIPEQRKIADCLTALDNLISAQSQKIEALKQYKKGLLQQLFPSSEETSA